MPIFSTNLVGALIAMQPTPAYESVAVSMIKADPFTNYIEMTDNELREARGGFRVGDDFIDIAGFYITFAETATRLDVSPTAPGGLAFEAFSTQINADAAEIVINNTLDNVDISATRSYNVVIGNVDQAVNNATMSNAVARAVADGFVLGGVR